MSSNVTDTLKINSDEQILIEKADLHLSSGNLQAAVDTLTLINERYPNNFYAPSKLSRIAYDNGQEEYALSYAKKALLNLDQAEVAYELYDLGVLFLRLGRHKSAITCLDRSLQLSPEDIKLLTTAGLIERERKQHQNALNYFLKVKDLQISCDILIKIGEELTNLFRVDEAIPYFNEAIKIDSSSVKAKTCLGGALISAGQIEQAQKILSEALSIDDNYAEAYCALSASKKFTDDDKPLIQKIEDVLKNISNEAQAELLLYTLGKIYNDCKKYDKAFEYYKKANDKKSLRTSFSNSFSYSALARYKKVFTKELLKKEKRLRHQSQTPIFIVGMPRSGTTLTEQIISNHSKVFGAGEVPYIHDIALDIKPKNLPDRFIKEVPFPENIPLMNKNELKKLSENYLSNINSGINGSYKITNKLPGNFTYLGFINYIFPNATIIHCRRHPLDVCLSVYFQNFVSIDYSCDMALIAEYYKLYADIMKFWQDQMPDNIYNSYYEELLFKQEEMSKNLIARCGLKWEEQCLAFEKNDREIFTASRWQVRQKLYTDSMYRWKNYESHIQYWKEALHDEIEEYENQINKRLS